MAINTDHVTGFVVGLGAAGLAFYLYKRNQNQVDEWLRQQGLEIPRSPERDFADMSIEDLMATKEHLEDLVAEREAAEASAKPAEANVKPTNAQPQTV